MKGFTSVYCMQDSQGVNDSADILVIHPVYICETAIVTIFEKT